MPKERTPERKESLLDDEKRTAPWKPTRWTFSDG
jgi:hypothetical protein